MDRFVVGTGRCGSTLLTTMLGKHPELMVISEFFAALDRHEMLSDVHVAGTEFAAFVTRSNISTDVVLERGIIPKEVLGDVEGLTSIPPMLVSMLPMLSEKPRELLNELMSELETFPRQSMVAHYRQMFEWLMSVTGKTAWLERSGPAAEYLPQLVEAFPEGKYVLLHRDGRDTATSMMHHPYFQFTISMFFDPPTEAELADSEYGGVPASPVDMLSRRLSPDYLSPDKFGSYWSHLQLLTFKALTKLDRDQVFEVSFEDLVERPEECLREIATFLELDPNGAWAFEGASLMNGMPPSSFAKLPPESQRLLADALAPGELLLGRRDVEWIDATLILMREMAVKNGYKT